MGQTIGSPLLWTAFLFIVIVLLAIDLGLFHRKAHAVGVREALVWSIVWIAVSVSFGAWIYSHFGRQDGLEFFAGYLIEKALSVDNVFVFVLIFSYFSVPAHLHHRVLFWGILGALVMRAVFVVVGAALISAFHWVLYIFGVFLLFTGFKILREGETEVEPQKNPVVRLFRRLMPMASDYSSNGFFTREGGRLIATPLALVLVAVETTDLAFATDSIPAIFGVTHDVFIVYTSNICAIFGLRAMYFLLAVVIDRFVYLGKGLGIVLMFIGTKMLMARYFEISIEWSLSVVAAILVAAIAISLIWPPESSGDPSKANPPLVTSDSEKD